MEGRRPTRNVVSRAAKNHSDKENEPLIEQEVRERDMATSNREAQTFDSFFLHGVRSFNLRV